MEPRWDQMKTRLYALLGWIATKLGLAYLKRRFAEWRGQREGRR